MNKPKITVVTVCYNAVKEIERTLNSVISQTYDNLEYIVVDGGSKDGSLDVINKYERGINVWMSEPDKGIYDAMNKGVTLASGDYIIFMNAGDCFFNDEVLNDSVSKLGDLYPDSFYGDVIYQYTYGNKYVHAKEISYIENDMVCSHQSIFVKTNLLKNRPFDLQYKLAADYNFILSIYLSGASFKRIELPVSIVDSAGGMTYSNFIRSHKEVIKIKTNNGHNSIACYCEFVYKVTRFKIGGFIKEFLPSVARLFADGK